VDLDEVAFLVALESSASGAVGFVADDKLNLRQTVALLRAADDIKRVVGREDDAHVLGVVALLHFFSEATGVGGCGVTQLVSERLNDVFVLVALLPNFGVGTDGKAVQRNHALLCPLGQGLRQQVQTRDKEQDQLVLSCDSLRYLEAGKGLAGAASHNELAPVSGLKTPKDRVVSAQLMGPERILRLEHRRSAGLKLRPVDLAVFEVMKIDLVNRWLLVAEGILRVLAPVIRRGDDDALGERLLAGRGEEAVDVSLADTVVRREALALNRMVFRRPMSLGDEINPCILG